MRCEALFPWTLLYPRASLPPFSSLYCPSLQTYDPWSKSAYNWVHGGGGGGEKGSSRDERMSLVSRALENFFPHSSLVCRFFLHGIPLELSSKYQKYKKTKTHQTNRVPRAKKRVTRWDGWWSERGEGRPPLFHLLHSHPAFSSPIPSPRHASFCTTLPRGSRGACRADMHVGDGNVFEGKGGTSRSGEGERFRGRKCRADGTLSPTDKNLHHGFWQPQRSSVSVM